MQKTHPPTRRRTERALREGDSPISLAVVRAGALLVFALLAPAAAGALKARFQILLRAALSKPESADPGRLATEVLLVACPLVAAMAVTASAVGLIQTRGVATWGKAAPRFDRMSPGSNLTRLWSGLSIYEALRGLVVTGVLLLAATRSLMVTAPDLASVVSRESAGLGAAGTLGTRLLFASVLALLGLAAVDIAVKRAAWRQRWRMSARDIIDERRESEGDPEVKRARRRAHAELDGRGAR